MALIVGLIDVDGHNFPNLALMRISAWHKAQGDLVEWYQPPMFRPMYDIVYMSKVFSDAYSPDIDEPLNAREVRKGGTGYCISLGADGKEHFDESKNHSLPPEVERMFPDYSIYPQHNFAVCLTSRGCPNDCGFCHVTQKEGRCSVKVANVSDFWNGQPHIEVLDPNITACREKRDLLAQYKATGATICFNQGLDIRLINDADIEDINAMRLTDIHFAWDRTDIDLTKRFQYWSQRTNKKTHGSFGTVYCLTNYDDCSVTEHIEKALWRIYTLRDMNFDPFLMVYDKPHADKRIREMQRWCNNKWIFKSCKRFEDYKPTRHGRSTNETKETSFTEAER